MTIDLPEIDQRHLPPSDPVELNAALDVLETEVATRRIGHLNCCHCDGQIMRTPKGSYHHLDFDYSGGGSSLHRAEPWSTPDELTG